MILLLFQKNLPGTGGSRLGLSTNDKISVENLLYGLLLVSGNDAAVALSEYVANDLNSFSTLMNEKARELNLVSTHFISPHGLDHEDHYTTALELAILTDYALQNSIFYKIVNTNSYTININNTTKNLKNTNELLNLIDGIYGVKTGFTNGANRCLVSACKRNNIDIICVVLGCDTKKDRTIDSINLINYIFNNYKSINIKNILESDFISWKKENLKLININKGIYNNFDVYLDTSKLFNENYTVLNNSNEKLFTKVKYNHSLKAPLDKNATIGTISLYYDSNFILSLEIKNKNIIDKKNIIYYLQSFFTNYFSYFDYKFI